jgi:Protein of unknown function (DUF3592)
MLNVTRLVAVVIAIALVVSALYAHILAGEVKSWPTTVGTLDMKGIVGYGAGSYVRAGNTNDYAVSVRYSYRVGDKNLTGSNVRVWDMTFNSRALAEDYLKNNQSGSSIPVSYNPANPAQSYLSTAYPVVPISLLLVGAFISGGFAIFWLKLSRFFLQWAISRET